MKSWVVSQVLKGCTLFWRQSCSIVFARGGGRLGVQTLCLLPWHRHMLGLQWRVVSPSGVDRRRRLSSGLRRWRAIVRRCWITGSSLRVLGGGGSFSRQQKRGGNRRRRIVRMILAEQHANGRHDLAVVSSMSRIRHTQCEFSTSTVSGVNILKLG